VFNQWLVPSVKNALNEETFFTTDSTGRLTKTTRADAKEVLMSQDPKGNLVSITPAEKTAHTFNWSKTNEPASYTPPGGPAESSVYDKDGLVTESTHFDLTKTLVTREPSGRVTKVTTPWFVNDFTYLPSGQVGQVKRGSQTVDYTYDGMLLKGEKTNEATSKWTYDTDFRVTRHDVNDAGVAYGYDNDSLLISAGPMTIARLPLSGQITSTTVGNVVTSYTYNTCGEVESMETKTNGTAVYREGIQYDNAGRINVVEETVQSVPTQWNYGYDPIGRLTSVAKNNGIAVLYSYDGNGNRISAAGVASSFDAQDRILIQGPASFTWDALGNRAAKSDGTVYVHDGSGGLKSWSKSGLTISFEHDGAQRRVVRKRDGVVTAQYVYDGQIRVVAELVSGSRFVYATQSHSPDLMLRNGQAFVLVKNHLGSVRLVLNTVSGAVLQSIDYDAWGAVTQNTSPGFQPFGFAGGIWDGETQLTHFGYRDYDVTTGTFTSRDPIRLKGALNTFEYAENSPASLVDPSGLQVTCFNTSECECQRDPTSSGCTGVDSQRIRELRPDPPKPPAECAPTGPTKAKVIRCQISTSVYYGMCRLRKILPDCEARAADFFARCIGNNPGSLPN
jgi:RHS repeat-associated protein